MAEDVEERCVVVGTGGPGTARAMRGAVFGRLGGVNGGRIKLV